MLLLLDRGFDARRLPRRGRTPPGRCCWPAPAPPATPASCGTCPTAPTFATWRAGGADHRGRTDRHRRRRQRVTDSYRLITTLIDHRRLPGRGPGPALSRALGDRVGVSALRHTLLNGHVLRSGDRPGAGAGDSGRCSTLYQLLRMAMGDAVETRPGTDPDRASFTTALEAARDQLTAAAGSAPPARPTARRHRPRRPGRPAARPPPPLQRPQSQMLHLPLPQKRRQPPAAPPPSPRSTSPCTPRPCEQHPAAPAPPRHPARPQPPTRRQRITAIITSQPPRDWSGHELAEHLHVKPRNMLTQLGEWGQARLLHPNRLRHLRPQHASPATSTNEPDP